LASAAITFTAGSEGGAKLRALANAILRAAADVPDRNSSGASLVCTISDAPATGNASVVISGGGLPTQQTYIV
jgi:hypothetical protein